MLEEFSVEPIQGEDPGGAEPQAAEASPSLEPGAPAGAERGRAGRRGRRTPLENKLSRGEEILVQVSKEPMGTKGSRVTSYISLAGRYLVFMPTTNHIGVSRRIADELERKRLRIW